LPMNPYFISYCFFLLKLHGADFSPTSRPLPPFGVSGFPTIRVKDCSFPFSVKSVSPVVVFPRRSLLLYSLPSGRIPVLRLTAMLARRRQSPLSWVVYRTIPQGPTCLPFVVPPGFPDERAVSEQFLLPVLSPFISSVIVLCFVPPFYRNGRYPPKPASNRPLLVLFGKNGLFPSVIFLYAPVGKVDVFLSLPSKASTTFPQQNPFPFETLALKNFPPGHVEDYLTPLLESDASV